VWEHCYSRFFTYTILAHCATCVFLENKMDFDNIVLKPGVI